MSDKPKDRMSLTPIPTNDFYAVSRNIVKVGTAVTRIESAVDTIKDDLLPPVSKAAQEARDGVFKLNGRVTALENDEHKCVDELRQQRQDNDIAENRVATASTSKLVWWLMGIAIVVGGSAMGFALVSKGDSSSAMTQLRDLDGVDTKVAQHDVQIQELQKAQARDRQTYLKTVESLPTKVKEATQRRQPTIEEIESAAVDLPMTERERDMLQRILTKARARTERRGSDD